MPLKGRAVIFQSGGCTPVINQSLAGVVHEAKRSRYITDIWGSRYGVAGLLNDDMVDLGRQESLIMRYVRHLPSAALGSNRLKLRDGEEYRILDRLNRHKVGYLFLIGGNDTAETILRLARAVEVRGSEIRIIHVPKTIDNDLVGTDHSPGYGSVARFTAITTQEAGLDSFAMRHVDPVKIIEVMGRNSGWIVAASALLKKSEIDPPHILLYPEVPFEKDRFLKSVDRVLTKIGYCIVVISETIRDAQGVRVGARTEGILKDSFGHPYVEGAAHTLARMVEGELKIRARFDKPGTIQRMSIPYGSDVDHKEAFLAGQEAVRMALGGLTKVMVGFERARKGKYRITCHPVPLEKVAGKESYMPKSFGKPGGVSQGFLDYALPLIGSGIPKFFKLRPIQPKL